MSMAYVWFWSPVLSCAEVQWAQLPVPHPSMPDAEVWPIWCGLVFTIPSPPPRCPKCILLLPARPLGSVGTTRAISFPLPAPSSPLQAAPGSRRGHGAQASPQQTWSRRWGAFLLETPASPHLHHMVLLLSAAPLLSPSGSSFYAHLSPGAPRVGKEPICLP